MSYNSTLKTEVNFSSETSFNILDHATLHARRNYFFMMNCGQPRRGSSAWEQQREIGRFNPLAFTMFPTAIMKPP
jgi:hypothetical protein